jgi:hypothetical protein
VQTVEHENFRVEDFGVGKKESLFAGQVSLSRCSDVYIKRPC